MEQFKKDDVVLSNSKASKGIHGIVWKVSDYGVHVNFGTIKEPSNQVFHFKTTHHKQSPVSEITHANKTGESLNK